jgi:spore germination cell wall hydrolase CwlJ-like protein
MKIDERCRVTLASSVQALALGVEKSDMVMMAVVVLQRAGRYTLR